MQDWPLLSIIIFTPIVGAVAISQTSGSSAVIARNSKYSGLLTTGVTFVFAMIMWLKVGLDFENVSLEQDITLLENLFLRYTLGVDGISLYFILLTAFLGVVFSISTFISYVPKMKGYMVSFLVLQSMMFGVFAAQNIMLFFLFLSGSLIPLFIMIGISGGRANRSAFHFGLLYVFSIMIIFLALLVIAQTTGSATYKDLSDLTQLFSSPRAVWWVLFAGFAIIVPIFPLSSWYGNVLNYAPLPTVIFIIGIMTKIGFYGLLRLNITIFPGISNEYSIYVIGISLFSSLYAVISAVISTNIKKTIGYIIMSIMNIAVAGLFIMTTNSITSSIFSALFSTIAGGGLLIVCCIVHRRVGSYNMNKLGGLNSSFPLIGFSYLFMALTVAGIPFTGGFVANFLAIVSIFTTNHILAGLVGVLFVIIASTILSTYISIYRGDMKTIKISESRQMLGWEKYFIIVYILIIIIVGVVPNAILSPIENEVGRLMNTLGDISL